MLGLAVLVISEQREISNGDTSELNVLRNRYSPMKTVVVGKSDYPHNRANSASRLRAVALGRSEITLQALFLFLVIFRLHFLEALLDGKQ